MTDLLHAVGYVSVFCFVFLISYKTILEATEKDDPAQPPRNQYPFDPEEF